MIPDWAGAGQSGWQGVNLGNLTKPVKITPSNKYPTNNHNHSNWINNSTLYIQNDSLSNHLVRLTHVRPIWRKKEKTKYTRQSRVPPAQVQVPTKVRLGNDYWKVRTGLWGWIGCDWSWDGKDYRRLWHGEEDRQDAVWGSRCAGWRGGWGRPRRCVVVVGQKQETGGTIADPVQAESGCGWRRFRESAGRCRFRAWRRSSRDPRSAASARWRGRTNWRDPKSARIHSGWERAQ